MPLMTCPSLAYVNWLDMVGATMAYTLYAPDALFLSMSTTFKMNDLSVIAPKGH